MSEITKISAVDRLEDLLLALPQVDLKTEHALSGGMYARTIHIPAGASLTGATHKTDHINIVIGDITVTTDDGPRRITGYQVFATKAGSKRAGIAHQDTAWTTVIRTDSTDIAAIEDEAVVESSKLQTRNPLLPKASAPEQIE